MQKLLGLLLTGIWATTHGEYDDYWGYCLLFLGLLLMLHTVTTGVTAYNYQGFCLHYVQYLLGLQRNSVLMSGPCVL